MLAAWLFECACNGGIMSHFVRYAGTISLLLFFFLQSHHWLNQLFLARSMGIIYGSMGFFLEEFQKLVMVVILSGGLMAYFSARLSRLLKVHYLFGLFFSIGLQTLLILIAAAFHRELCFSYGEVSMVSTVYVIDAQQNAIRFDASPMVVSLLIVQALYAAILFFVTRERTSVEKHNNAIDAEHIEKENR